MSWEIVVWLAERSGSLRIVAHLSRTPALG